MLFRSPGKERGGGRIKFFSISGTTTVFRMRIDTQLRCEQTQADGGNGSVPLLPELSMEGREGAT